MNLSHSKWNKYRQCAYAYYLHYHERWRYRFKKSKFAFGHVCQDMITEMLHSNNEIDPVRIFTTLWKRKARGKLEYCKNESYEKYKSIGQILAVRARDKLRTISNIANIEGKFEVPFGANNEHLLIGYVDFTGEYRNKKTLFDAKTQASFVEHEAKMSNQLTFYALATGIRTVGHVAMKKTITNPTIEIIIGTRTHARIKEFARILERDIGRIEQDTAAKSFDQVCNKMACGMCDFKPICFGTKRDVESKLVQLRPSTGKGRQQRKPALVVSGW